MAAKLNLHRYGTKLRHRHPLYTNASADRRYRRLRDRKLVLYLYPFFYILIVSFIL